ncbi:NAD(P)-binding domain-containing protein [Flavobacterium sp. JP2137]|uniref:NAD(P)-binding domain-containing protein n=1 Tax=Flavobacterium sp. JP2137 TaxID=3414510 RepID=UPI003D2FE031
MNFKNNAAVAVIGGGQAGLAVSYYLTQLQIDHVVFEKDRIGSSWTQQRWDSFRLNTPNWMNTLPGELMAPTVDPHAFTNHLAFVAKLQDYARIHGLPVMEHSEICQVTRDSNQDFFHLEVQSPSGTTHWTARQLVVAAGMMNRPNIPALARLLPPSIRQLHAIDYKNPDQIAATNILIVGSGQTGCQLAEELSATHRVYLSTAKVGRSPRRYRGLDMMDWMNKMGIMDLSTQLLTESGQREGTQPQVSGVGHYGHTISLQSLRQQGVSLLGRCTHLDRDFLHFDASTLAHIHYADAFSAALKAQVDRFVENHNLKAIEDDNNDLADRPDCDQTTTYSTQLPLTAIDTVIWATGYRADFDWIKFPIIGSNQQPIHTDGVSPIKGIYYIGFPWLRKKKSGIVFGVAEDAAFITKQIIRRL